MADDTDVAGTVAGADLDWAPFGFIAVADCDDVASTTLPLTRPRWNCRQCTVDFRSEAKASKHFAVQHLDYAPYGCPFAGCTVTLFSRRKLAEHITARAHGERASFRYDEQRDKRTRLTKMVREAAVIVERGMQVGSSDQASQDRNTALCQLSQPSVADDAVSGTMQSSVVDVSQHSESRVRQDASPSRQNQSLSTTCSTKRWPPLITPAQIDTDASPTGHIQQNEEDSLASADEHIWDDLKAEPGCIDIETHSSKRSKIVADSVRDLEPWQLSSSSSVDLNNPEVITVTHMQPLPMSSFDEFNEEIDWSTQQYNVSPTTITNPPASLELPDHLRLIAKPGTASAWYVHFLPRQFITPSMIDKAVTAGKLRAIKAARRHPEGKWSSFKQQNTSGGQTYMHVWMSADTAAAALAIRAFMCDLLDGQLKQLPENTFLYANAQQVLPREVTDVGQVLEAQPHYVRYFYNCAAAHLYEMCANWAEFDTDDLILIACDVVTLSRQAELAKRLRCAVGSVIPAPFTTAKYTPPTHKLKKKVAHRTPPSVTCKRRRKNN